MIKCNGKTKPFDLDDMGISIDNDKETISFKRNFNVFMVAKQGSKFTFRIEDKSYLIKFKEDDVIHIAIQSINETLYLYIDNLKRYYKPYLIEFNIVESSPEEFLCNKPEDSHDRFLFDIIFDNEKFEIINIPEKIYSDVLNIISNFETDDDNLMLIKYISEGCKHQLQIYTDRDRYTSKEYSKKTIISIDWKDSLSIYLNIIYSPDEDATDISFVLDEDTKCIADYIDDDVPYNHKIEYKDGIQYTIPISLYPYLVGDFMKALYLAGINNIKFIPTNNNVYNVIRDKLLELID